MNAVEEALVERVVQDRGEGRIGCRVREQRGHRGEAHHRRPGGGERAQRLGEQRGPHQVDGEDAAPVGHRGRDAGRVGDGPQRAEFRDARREPGEAVTIGDVEDERLGDGSLTGVRQLLGGRAHGRLVPVHQQQRVHHAHEPPRTGQPHPAPGAGHDPHGRHDFSAPASAAHQYCSKLGCAFRLSSSTRKPVVLR